jgi:glycosyltransferase involved in cell wall biosynthesis
MDDVPAGPASPEPRRPSLSVVVPVRNGGPDFERCLRRLRDSFLTDYELIVIDDGSTDNSADLAIQAGATVFRNPAPQGPAAARNLGARIARADLIFFLDADVAVYPRTLGLARARFEVDRGLSALFGSYDSNPAAPGIVSQYRNLLHHFVHQQGSFEQGIRPAHTFWTGCGMIRRDVFLAFGGFDPRLYPRPAIEDIELGYRLTQSGHRIVLARDVLATHMKRWSLAEMVRTDIFSRGVPWAILIKRTSTIETDLNVKSDQKACVVFTAILILAALCCVVTAWAAVVSVSALAAIVLLNRAFLGFLARRKGLAFVCAALPLHLIYYCCCGLSVIIAEYYWFTRGRDQGSTPSIPRTRTHHGASTIPAPQRRGGRDDCRAGASSRKSRRDPDLETITSEAAHEDRN